MQTTFHLPIRVYFEDTDAGGVVYHSNYLNYFERARTEFLRHLGFEQHQMLTDGECSFVVSSLSIDYLRAARLDDQLDIVTRLTRVRAASFTFRQEAYRQDELLTRADVKIACINPKQLRPRAIPEAIFQTISVAIHGEK